MAKANHTPTLIKPMAARRGVLLGALMALAAPKAATAGPERRAEDAAKTLAAALGELHGEQWTVTVDHAHGFVLMLRGGVQ